MPTDNEIRIKRRAVGGASGAPASLLQSELAYSEVDDILYIGKGTGGTATVVAIAGPGSYATKTYVDSAVASVDVSSQLANYLTTATAASTYLTQSSASTTYLTQSSAASTYVSQTSASSTYLSQSSAASTYLSQSNAASTYLTQSTASSTYAPLASPSFTGNPTATTQTAGDASTKLATTQFVASAISAVVGAAPDALNTLKELSDALGADASFSTTVTNSLAGKLAKASNLSDLTDASAARTNLGLGTIAVQSASNVNITGGTLSGVSVNGGTF